MRHLVRATLPVLLVSMILAVAVRADEAPYTEGSVMEMTFVRVTPGGDEAYLKYLDAQWKALNEAAKTNGLILSYHIIQTAAANKDDWNMVLVVEYKNMAALDGLETKMRALVEKTFGSIDKAEQQTAKRGEIREIIGEKIGRELILK